MKRRNGGRNIPNDFFDDCPICQYSKKRQVAGLPEEQQGLLEAFRVAARLPGVYVGGSGIDFDVDDDDL